MDTSISEKIKNRWHKFLHLIGHNKGTHEVWWAGDKLMVCFRCYGCNQLEDVHEHKI